MKVFIIPDGSITGADVSAVCKRLNLKVTTDVDKADVLIGNDNLRTKKVSWNISIPVVKMTEVDRIYFVSCKEHQHKSVLDYLQGTLNLNLDNLPEVNQGDTLLFANKTTLDQHYPRGINNYDYDSGLFVSDSIMQVVYYALDKKLPVVNDSKLFESLEKITLTEESYETLLSMYKSSDSDDWKTANQIVFNCNYEKSILYLWQIWEKYSYKLRKDSKKKIYDNFIEACDYFLEESLDDILIISAQEKKLTETFYNWAMENMIEDATNRVNKDTWLVTKITPKFTYHEFLNHHQNVNQPI
jgi:hypothetical protein